MPPRRDPLKDQQLVRDLWKQVEARIDCSNALRAFLTEKIDDCGQTVAFDAFDLVRQVLNPEGFVRRAHKGADQPLGSAIEMPESPWSAEGSIVHRKWDFQSTWTRQREQWPSLNDYTPLTKAAVDLFCTASTVKRRNRSQRAVYRNNPNADLDATYAIPRLSATLTDMDLLSEIPDDGRPLDELGIRRWETYHGIFPDSAYKSLINNPSSTWEGKIVLKRSQTGMTIAQIRQRINADPDKYRDASQRIGQPNGRSNKKAWNEFFKNEDSRELEHEQENAASASNKEATDDEEESDDEEDDAAAASGSKEVAAADAVDKKQKHITDLTDLLKNNKKLEPYWRLTWRNKLDNLGLWNSANDKICDLQEKPDLILEVGYFCSNSGLFKKRVIICEVDGADKTEKKKDSDDQIKLAMKLMISTCAQNELQQETYHIRANYAWYFDKLTDRSLLTTTDIDLPQVADLMRLYGKDSKTKDYTTLHHAIHFMHNMFKAHVKIAFLIHMQVVHDIDIRTMDKKDLRMRDHCFFVNFEGQNIPEALTWHDRLDAGVQTWLESKQMFHTQVQIKTAEKKNTDVQYQYACESTWVKAPVLDASSSRSALRDWKARVTSARLPRYPYEKETCVPVACATIQRVDMKSLIDVVRKAAQLSSSLYTNAIELKTRAETSICSRQFPDRCFLTRKQQYSRFALWNFHAGNNLSQRMNAKQDDLLEFTWGYESPLLIRNFKDTETMTTWDQLDVRMHFFDLAMMQDQTWQDLSEGMWYVQDYHDFFDMLRKLPKPDDTKTAQLTPTNVNYTHEQNLQRQKYALHAGEMPEQTENSARAYHMFSILSWFFDSRDAGACRWQWEDHILTYFGAEAQDGTPSDFDKFRFERNSTSEVKYFDNTWFVMMLLMEVNFRNAITAMHFRLWDNLADKQSMTASSGLQARAKELYNRQHSLLNTRARCPGLQGVTAGLSWKKNPERNCLRNLLLSSLDDTLPRLDPQLEQYLRQFNAPNAELFLRTIEVSNVLALRELALQHKLASQTSPAASKLESRLSWFEPAVQSEIRHLMHCVERDDSVFTAAPVVHPTKAIVLEEELMRKWVRQTLGVHQHMHTLRCPLDVKFHMFTSPETYRVLMQLFCTKTQLDNSHTQRPVLFVLLQVYLAAEVLKGAKQEADTDTAVNKVQRMNSALELAQEDLPIDSCHITYKFPCSDSLPDVPCTPGSSLASWPLRDQNLWCKPRRDAGTKKVILAGLPRNPSNLNINGVVFTPNERQDAMQLEYQAEEDIITQDMAVEELRRWLLLACARPVPCQYERQDNGRYAAGEKKHEFTMHECLVRQQAEWTHSSATGRQRDTIIAAVSYFGVSDEHRLEVCVSDDTDTYIFFEPVVKPLIDTSECFPGYIQDIITEIPDRRLIYVPQVFARHLRKESIHDKIYTHAKRHWRMVCVGYRAWAWKRLLVKRIFFDALTKVVTRSSVLLSLWQNVDGDATRINRQYRQMLADTKDTFGALELKTVKIKSSIEQKRLQPILTVFQKSKRLVSINGQTVDLHGQCKVSEAQRQVSWCKFLQEHSPTQETSRFMLVDKRIQQALFPTDKAHMESDDNVLQYRSYLYTQRASKHLVVFFKGNVYVKFPQTHSIFKTTRKNEADEDVVVFQAGETIVQTGYNYFATCCDCRTYSCLKPEYLLSPDSAETTAILTEHAQSDALLRKITLDSTHWPSTPHNDLEACKYICLDGEQSFSLKTLHPIIHHSVLSITEAVQNDMYTLPDMFKQPVNVDALPSMQKVDDWNDTSFVGNLRAADSRERETVLWNKLRNSSKYVMTTSNNANGHVEVMQVLDTGTSSFDDPFAEIVSSMRRRIGPKPNEDS